MDENGILRWINSNSKVDDGNVVNPETMVESVWHLSRDPYQSQYLWESRMLAPNPQPPVVSFVIPLVN